MILGWKMALFAEEESQSHLWWAWWDVLGVVDCSGTPELTHIQLTSRTCDEFTAHNMAGDMKGGSRAPTTCVSWFLLTVMWVPSGSLSTRLCTHLPSSLQTEVSETGVDTSWARGASLWFFSHYGFCMDQVCWAPSQTSTITSLAQESSFPRGQLLHPPHLHHLMH